MEIVFQDGEVIVHLPKCVLVMSRQQFIEALKRGKAYRRRQAMQARQQDTASAGTVPGDVRGRHRWSLGLPHRHNGGDGDHER